MAAGVPPAAALAGAQAGPPQARPRVSILVVTYNGAVHIPPLLASLAASEARDAELVVVDNQSSDGTADLVARLAPQARLIRANRNLGFCAGNNLAARNATGDILVLLNQDTVVRDGWLDALVGALAADPKAGCAQSKVLLHRDPRYLNSVGCGVNYLFFGWAEGNGRLDDVHGAPFEVPYAQGAALAIGRELYDRLGGFDEPFFMYHDDLELGLKVRLAGLRCLCVPASVVLHNYNEVSAPHKLYLLERNRQIMLWKYYRPWTRAVLFPVRLVIDLGVFLLAIPQGWWREKLLAHRDAWRLRHFTRGPPPAHPYSDRDLVLMLGTRFEAGNVAPSFNQRVARRLLHWYHGVAWLLASRRRGQRRSDPPPG